MGFARWDSATSPLARVRFGGPEFPFYILFQPTNTTYCVLTVFRTKGVTVVVTKCRGEYSTAGGDRTPTTG